MTLPVRPLVVIVAAAYLVAVVAIGIWAARRTHTSRDYFIAGQRIGLWVTGLATMSAAFSGFVFMGGPGLTYRMGLASLWIVLPLGVTAGMLCWVVAAPLRRLATGRAIYTIPDVVAARFGSPAATGLAAAGVALGATAYLGAQLLALAVLLQAIFGWASLVPGLLLGLGVLLAYSVAGGMVAGVYTDVLQGGLMLATSTAIFVRSLQVAGGWRAATTAIAESDAFGPAFLLPLGQGAALTAFGFFFVFGVGVLGQPQMLHKFLMIGDPRKLRWLPLVLGGSQAACVLIWVGIGLAVPALVAQGGLPPLGNPDDAAPVFLLRHTPDLLAGLAFAGVLSAIMSSADSFVNIAAAAMVRDLPRAFGRPSGSHELRRARVAAFGVTLAAAGLAWGYGDLIALLGTLAFGTFAATLAPALAIGLNWQGVTARAATASMATGLVLCPTLEFLTRQQLFEWLPRPLAAGAVPAAAALAVSFAVLVGVSTMTRGNS